MVTVQENQARDREVLRGEIREGRAFAEAAYRDLYSRVKVLEAGKA